MSPQPTATATTAATSIQGRWGAHEVTAAHTCKLRATHLATDTKPRQSVFNGWLCLLD